MLQYQYFDVVFGSINFYCVNYSNSCFFLESFLASIMNFALKETSWLNIIMPIVLPIP